MGAISILVLVLACAASSYALPGGAPTSTCVNLTPGHPVGAQSNPGPYEIDISAFMNSYGGMPMAYLPGAYYTSMFFKFFVKICLQGMNFSIIIR